MNGHNVVELHSFSVMPVNTPERPTRPVTRQPRTVPTRTLRPVTAILRRSSPYSARPPYYIHATDRLPHRRTTDPVYRLRVFLLTNPLVYGTLYYDIPILFHQSANH